jgi:pimeloyl-ACP methyl ester carboxylesterase
VEFLLSAGKVFLGVAIGLPLVVYFLQDRLLFQPYPLHETQRAEVRKRFPAVEEVFLQSDSHKIHAWHVKAAPGAPLILYFGGNAEDVSGMIGDAIAQAPGASWLLVSYRGYGGSEGSPSAASIMADALQWHDYAVNEINPRRVFAFGRSVGSGAAVHLAAARPLAGVVLVTPFDSLAAVAKRYYWYLPVDLLLKHRFDSIQLAPKILAPLLCIAAERDEVIPPEHARRLYEAWAGPKQWVPLPGAGHNSTDGLPAFWNSIRGFLKLGM